MSKNIICIAGPTASGKSAVSAKLANHFPIEIINVDSATIYREMDIGTAKPDCAERKQITHHLLDILDPSESYSAARFVKDAHNKIYAAQSRGNIPILCGGTMMYFKALREGLNELPSADHAIRQQIERDAIKNGWPSVHKKLSEIDPVTAARLEPNDSQRIQRALEIYLCSGTNMTEWLEKPPIKIDDSLNFITISLEPENRSKLHEKIKRRYHAMLEMGLLEEVEKLYNRGDLSLELPSMRCVGYRQIWQYLDGDVCLDQAIEGAIAATRQLAKRQITWLRSQPDRIIAGDKGFEAVQKILNQ